MTPSSRRAALAAGLAALLACAACRRSAEPGQAQRSASGAPEPALRKYGRIIPANTAAAEFLAVLLGERGPDRIVALPEQVDEYACFDFESGAWAVLPRFARYTAEALAVLDPDLVVTHAWQSVETTEVLRAQGVPMLVLESARSFEDVRGALERLAKTLDVAERGVAVIADLDRRVAAIQSGARNRSALRALVYTNDGTGGWTAGSETTADAVIRMTGMRNAAAEAGLKGHVALDYEKLLRIDPDVIVVGARAKGEGGSATKSVLESARELAGLSAVAKRRIVVLPATLMSTDSPFLVDAAERLAAVVAR